VNQPGRLGGQAGRSELIESLVRENATTLEHTKGG